MTLVSPSRAVQRGGFALGLIVGLLVGLALALAVALYVTKVPVPFVNKVPQRTAEQDAAEAERNKNWDPNAPLTGKPAARGAAGASSAPPAPAAPAAPTSPPRAATPDVAPPAVVGRPIAPGTTPAATAPGAAASAPAKFGTDPFTYFVQAGAYQRPEEAEQQRARLAMLGFAAKVTEREQSGRTVYRVRLGPYDKKEDADGAKARLEGNGVEAALVRVQR